MTHRLEGTSEWLRCKALRMRAQGVYLKYMTKPESDSNAADWLLWHTAHKIFGKGFGSQPPETSSLPHPSWKPARAVLVRAVSFGFRRNPVYESFEVHCCPVYVFWSSLLSGKVLLVSAKLPPDSNRCLRTHLDTALYVNKRVPNFTTPTTKTRVFSAHTPNFQQILFGKLWFKQMTLESLNHLTPNVLKSNNKIQ